MDELPYLKLEFVVFLLSIDLAERQGRVPPPAKQTPLSSWNGTSKE